MNAKKNPEKKEKRPCLICGRPEKSRELCPAHLARYESARTEFVEKTQLPVNVFEDRAIAAKKVGAKQIGGRPRKKLVEDEKDPLDLFILEIQAEYGMKEESGKAP